MRCVSLSGSLESVLASMPQGDMAEIRMDLLEDFSVEDVQAIFSMPVNTIATCRKGKFSDDERKEYLLKAIHSGANWVDVDIQTDIHFLEEIKKELIGRSCKLILSYHDFEQTPSIEELQQIQGKCADLGADLIKIATVGRTPRDVARIIRLYDSDSTIPLLALSMGEIGKMSRVMALILGAPFTFVVPDTQSQTAPGQFTLSEFTSLWENIKNAATH